MLVWVCGVTIVYDRTREKFLQVNFKLAGFLATYKEQAEH